MTRFSNPDWPAPVERLNTDGCSDVILLCEHASNYIPPEYNALGLEPADLERHIAWDPGAGDVTRRLSAILDAPAYLGTYSRLLIDLNRPLSAPDSVVTRSENTDIPGNTSISDADIEKRRSAIFLPFHKAVTDHLDARSRRHRPTRLVCIHSFTPVFMGTPRSWQGGVLFDKAVSFGTEIVSTLKSAGLTVDTNVPYKTNREEDYSVPVHGDDRGIPAILIEIRNDEISSPDGVAKWAVRIAASLQTWKRQSADKESPVEPHHANGSREALRNG